MPFLQWQEAWHVQAPDAMRSSASALQLLTTALGSYVATAVTDIINAVRTTAIVHPRIETLQLLLSMALKHLLAEAVKKCWPMCI